MGNELTSRERVERILDRKPVDRIGVYEAFWSDTKEKWVSEGHVGEDEDLHDHFGHDIRECWAFNMVADPGFEEEIVEEITFAHMRYRAVSRRRLCRFGGASR